MRRAYRAIVSAWFVGIFAIGWVVMTGVFALTDSDPELFIAMLMGWAILSTILMVIAFRLSQNALDRNLSALNGWSEQEELTLDLTHLMSEALDHLSTWDRETADEIADRTNTVIRLRFQNFQERNHP